MLELVLTGLFLFFKFLIECIMIGAKYLSIILLVILILGSICMIVATPCILVDNGILGIPASPWWLSIYIPMMGLFGKLLKTQFMTKLGNYLNKKLT